MKTDEELLLNVINHMNSLAMFAPTNADQYVLTGAQIEKLSDSQIAKYEEGVVWLLTELAHQTENASLQGEFEGNDMVSLKIFQYIFVLAPLIENGDIIFSDHERKLMFGIGLLQSTKRVGSIGRTRKRELEIRNYNMRNILDGFAHSGKTLLFRR